MRPAMPCLRISATARFANSSGGRVALGSRGDSFVSQSKPTFALPDFFTRSKRSERRGIRVPSAGSWYLNSPAYFVPGFRRPTSYFCSSSKVRSAMFGPGPSSHLPSGPRVVSGFSRRSWWTTTTSSFVIAMSHSIVSTPSSRAFFQPGTVFSGASPRAPRWPCRSKAWAGSAARRAARKVARREVRVIVVFFSGGKR